MAFNGDLHPLVKRIFTLFSFPIEEEERKRFEYEKKKVISTFARRISWQRLQFVFRLLLVSSFWSVGRRRNLKIRVDGRNVTAARVCGWTFFRHRWTLTH